MKGRKDEAAAGFPDIIVMIDFEHVIAWRGGGAEDAQTIQAWLYRLQHSRFADQHAWV